MYSKPVPIKNFILNVLCLGYCEKVNAKTGECFKQTELTGVFRENKTGV